MKQLNVYALDLSEMEGNGDFPCPQCENAISPDDESEETYSILEPKVNGNGLEELIIRCNKCESIIHLTGFPLIQKLLDIAEDELKSEKDEKTLLQFSRVLPSLRLNLRNHPSLDDCCYGQKEAKQNIALKKN